MATLFDLAQAYLNRGMPSISPIFSNTTPTPTPQPTPPTQDPVQGLTPEQLLLLSSQGGGSDEFRGGGTFGNLDLSRSKTVTRDVYDEELGDFIPTELTAYYNPKLGNFQTFEGKNINPAFTNVPLGILGTGLEFLGIKPRTIGGFSSGKIRGVYDTPLDLIRRNKNEPPGMTPAQMTRRKKGLESLGKIYENIGRTRDNDRGNGAPGPGETSGGTFGSSTDDSSFSDYS